MEWRVSMLSTTAAVYQTGTEHLCRWPGVKQDRAGVSAHRPGICFNENLVKSMGVEEGEGEGKGVWDPSLWSRPLYKILKIIDNINQNQY
jgi:hypothetical protein